MPDLRMPALSRQSLMALVVVLAGIVAMLVALLSSSSSPNSDNPAQSDRKAVEPVAPLNPDDAGAQQAPKDVGKALDLTNPFASSYGKAGRRKVTVRITGNGAVNVGLYYRDKKRSQRQVNGSYSATRTVEGRYPLAAIAIQLPGNLPGSASRATCTIIIDGIEVTTQTAKQAGGLTICVG